LTETDEMSVAETGPDMHAQSRSLHPTATGAEESLRREAEHFLLVSGTSLIDVLRRSAEHGLALGFAFRDIVLDRETAPASWPIDDVLDVLTSVDARRDNRSASLEASLSGLSRLIDDVEDGSWEDAGEVSAAPGRLAA
jgi:hypothetical protein